MANGLRAPDLKAAHDAALPYEQYLETDAEQASRWRDLEPRVRLDEQQARLVSGFTRRMPVLVISGIWCGDCACDRGPSCSGSRKPVPASTSDSSIAMPCRT
jgi:hypothetical protein